MIYHRIVLVTGGAGYIGSHTCLALLQAGYEVVVLDNLCNSSPESLKRVQALAGEPLHFIEGDVRDPRVLRDIFARHNITAVMHFAGLKAVGESVEKPLAYFSVHVAGTIALCQAMQAAQVFTLVLSSSCTVYGDPQYVPIPEHHPTGNTANPYGYIHVVDLAEGHVAALVALARPEFAGLHAWNLVTGLGYSVLDVVRAFELACGQRVPYRIMPRRPGDIAQTYADPAKAKSQLGWTAKRDPRAMMRDAWHWQSMNPCGYAEPIFSRLAHPVKVETW